MAVTRAESETSPMTSSAVVALGGEGGPALGADGLVALDEDDAGAGLGQRLGAAEADAAAAAGDDGGLVVEAEAVEVHGAGAFRCRSCAGG